MKRLIIGMTTVAVVGMGSVFFNETVQANTINELHNKQSDVSSERSKIKDDLSKADAEIADVLFDLKEINEELVKVENALKENEQLMDETEDNIKETEKEIKGLEEEIEVLENRIEERNEILKDRVASYQENGGNIGYLEVLLGAKDFSEFISRVSAVTQITNSDAELIEEQKQDKAKIEDHQVEVEEKLADQETKKNEQEEMQGIIKEQKEANKESKKKLKNKENELKDLKANLESEDSDLAALETEIRQDIDSASNPPVADSVADSDSNTESSQVATSDSSQSTSQQASSEGSSSNATPTASKKDKTPKAKPTKNTGGGSAINVGKQFIGNSSYVYGAADPSNGRFDCSGFVSWAYGQEGVSVPRTTGALASAGTKVSPDNMQPGDLVFFNTNGHNGHVGIYIGGGNFIGSQSSSGVAIESMSSGYWKGQFSGTVRRVK